MTDYIGNGSQGEHTASNVSPSQQESVTLTAGESWALGDAVKIMDADTVDGNFVITNISIEWAEPYWDGEEIPYLPKF
jgi:hypothetical protein